MDRALPSHAIRRARLRRAGAIVLVGVAAWALLGWLPSRLAPGLDRGELRTAVVSRGDVLGVVSTTGRSIPAAETVLSSPVDARVLRIVRQPGERVAAGDAIVELDVSSARLDLARTGDELASKRSAAEARRLARDRELARLRAEIAEAELDVELARYRLTQRRDLHASGLASEAALREAEVEARKAAIALGQLEAGVEAAELEATSALRALEREASVLAQEAAEAERRLELAAARADRDGVLTWVVPEVGGTVGRGEVLARLADLSAYRVEATAADVHAGRLVPGQEVRVELGDDVLRGRLGRVFPTIENGAVRFLVTLDRPDHPALRSQRRLDVHVVTDAVEGALRLPRAPFALGGRADVVFVVDGDVLRRTSVVLGVVGPDWVEVEEGLEEGERVVTADLSEMAHLERIRLR